MSNSTSTQSNATPTGGGVWSDLKTFISDVTNVFGDKKLAWGLQEKELKALPISIWTFVTLFQRGAFSGVPADTGVIIPSPFEAKVYGKNQRVVCDQPATGDYIYSQYGVRWSRVEPGLEGIFTLDNGPPVSQKEFFFDPPDLWPVDRGTLTTAPKRMTLEQFNAGGGLSLAEFKNRIATRWQHYENDMGIPDEQILRNYQTENEQTSAQGESIIEPGFPPRGSSEQKINIAGIGLLGAAALAGLLLTRK